MVHIVGAGPGAPDLITVRGQKLLQEADVVIYAGSLVNPELLSLTKEGAVIYDSAKMTLEQVIQVISQAEEQGLTTVRLHTGDPCLYGAIREQMDRMKELGISYDICPGVSSFCGAAASLELEYTLPGVSQSVVITRMEGRTPVPEREKLASFAAHRSTMVLFLSAGMIKEASEELMCGGYPADTAAAVIYKATWPDEKKLFCRLDELADAAAAEGIDRTALILVGPAVAQQEYDRSMLYHPSFDTEYRKGEEALEAEKLEKICQAGSRRGVLSVVGIGPGSIKGMTGEAMDALRSSRVIAGYTVYVDLVRDEFPDKEFLMTPMTREEERCRMAFEACMEGKNTAMICSGDPGVYGMAGLILELSEEYPEVEIRIVPGVTAACAGAALLGAPLIHDFAVISLSDRLTPLETIWDRIEKAAAADLGICIYNPVSKGRPDYLRQACERILKYRSADTVCGLAWRIGREGEGCRVVSLGELADQPADMFTTVYIGNSSTIRIGDAMVTPRGYRFAGKP